MMYLSVCMFSNTINASIVEFVVFDTFGASGVVFVFFGFLYFWCIRCRIRIYYYYSCLHFWCIRRRVRICCTFWCIRRRIRHLLHYPPKCSMVVICHVINDNEDNENHNVVIVGVGVVVVAKFAIMQHLSHCDGNAMFRISSNNYRIWPNSYQNDKFGSVSDRFQVLTYLCGGPCPYSALNNYTLGEPPRGFRGNSPEQHMQTNCYQERQNPEGKPG
jgi:hypothetical protein